MPRAWLLTEEDETDDDVVVDDELTDEEMTDDELVELTEDTLLDDELSSAKPIVGTDAASMAAAAMAARGRFIRMGEKYAFTVHMPLRTQDCAAV